MQLTGVEAASDDAPIVPLTRQIACAEGSYGRIGLMGFQGTSVLMPRTTMQVSNGLFLIAPNPRPNRIFPR